MAKRERTEREKWFYERIGKRIYRNKLSCDCIVCRNVERDGLIIRDGQHAGYLFEVESITNYEGIPLKYFDTIEERNKFVKEIKPKK